MVAHTPGCDCMTCILVKECQELLTELPKMIKDDNFTRSGWLAMGGQSDMLVRIALRAGVRNIPHDLFKDLLRVREILMSREMLAYCID